MTFCVDCCSPEDSDEDEKQLAVIINDSKPSSIKEIPENRRGKIKLVNGQIPSELPSSHSKDWDPTKLLKQAVYDAIKQRTNKIDPNYKYYKSNSKYTVMFGEKFNHGLYKISKNYYIITQTDKVHRLTVETLLNDGAPQRIYLNSAVILSNRGPNLDIVWNPQICSPKIENAVHFISLTIKIEGVLYSLKTTHSHYEKTDDSHPSGYYFIDKPIESKVCSLLGACAILLCGSNTRRHNPKTPHFALYINAWDEKALGPVPENINLKEWICEIDTKTVVNFSWGIWNYIMLLVDIFLFIPAMIFVTLIMLLWFIKVCFTCVLCRWGCQEEQEEQEEVEYEPESVTFDFKEAVQYFGAIHS